MDKGTNNDEGLVFLAEDERAIRTLAQTAFNRVGLGILAAEDGHEARRLFRERVADISGALIDWCLPGASGDELCREIRRLRPDLPIIVVTGYDASSVKNSLCDLGVIDVIQKPFSFQVVAVQMLAAVSGERAQHVGRLAPKQ